MTIPEAIQLVIQIRSVGTGGDVFVLNMGQPVKISDFSKTTIGLKGKSPTEFAVESPDQIQIHYSGLRPGKKFTKNYSLTKTA
jgi:UDP-N-acetylglucosamine 4,6-dehydratase